MMQRLKLSAKLAICLTTILLSGCGVKAGYAINAVCDAWEDSMVLGSAKDTTETLRGLEVQYERLEAVCAQP